MSTGGGAGPLVPTFHGFVHNSMDGLVLFEACLSGKLHHVPRRPHDRERSSLIKSGSIFIYEENASGIKRWTDGVAWSPSRILGNFLIYRELEKPFPPGEKKRAMKRKRTSMPGEPYPRRDSDDNEGPELNTPLTPPTPNVDGEVKPEIPSSDQDKELERSLIGSLVDSYGFRPDGLVKKTMSISVNGISHHMVSYYKVDDVKNNLLPRPLSDPRLQNISVRPELYLKQNFRAPVEETEHYAIDGHMNAHPQMIYSPMVQPYGMAPSQYMGARQYPGMYGSTTGSSMYGAMTAASWPTQQATAGAMGYGSHQSYGSQPYPSYYKPTDQGNGSGVKTESQHSTSQAMPYGSQYAPSYPNMQRSNSVSAPSMMQSSYQTPVQPHSSTFGTMGPGSGRPSYSGQSMNSPSANGQSQGPYGSASTAPYAVRSPTQSYSMQSAPQSAVSHSPHPSMKSPQSAHPGTSSDPNGQLHSGGMPYRSGSYAVPSAPQTGHSDMNGLGISSTSSYPPPSQNGSGYSYGSTGHAQTSGPYPA
ncbi:Global transcription regulator sge1 [Fulvia fulva]|uniref:Global transcription regulator sge1 n=1 Tax=Passalora fulva TaxID=5499 RepID=A0A9Q8PBN1_PASFU|nr:Global transcription regulator sge1 [Fulvia fulva]KAK4621963.1 Global transcription regulator sge1 [Fulvia fulva]KAK4622784.1 Global transcription regulator sge1 [Fulvia fulva]UJO19505.1 Global transcription regulator sge1 [Fulvia fulva]WPV15675.1 Global transcription regulator sge1 [Fulvia fulva]WPV31340.1 Global transcription regulator sge1 [Fulvia fulva]